MQLPNATATLVLGILSIVSCFCYGFLGVILGIIGLAISANSVRMYKESPDLYEGYGNLKSGRIMCIIGLILSSIVVIVWLVYVVFLGYALSYDSFGNF